jgi:homoserine dehydrogenase
VVSANKKTIAENFEQLFKLQQMAGASLLYEGACGGSIPILRTLEEYYDNEELVSIKGILNGSSNYILSKMEKENVQYHEAVKRAQELGFAEKNPWLDVAGYDTKYKLCLLAAHGFGLVLKPEGILNSGLQNISGFDINYAKEKNLRIKLVGNIERIYSNKPFIKPGLKPDYNFDFQTPGLKAGVIQKLNRDTHSKATGYTSKQNWVLNVYVLPKLISRDEQLANVNYEYNGIEIEGIFSDRQFFYGKGAGSHPTGSAVLSDISAITYDYKYGYKKLKKRINGKPVNNGYQYFKDDNRFIDEDFSIKVYIRYKTHAELNILAIDEIEEEYKSHNNCYVIANVKFSSLRGIMNSKEVFVAVI